MDPKNETYLGIGLVRNEDYIGLYFNLTAWNIMKPKNVIQLSLRWGVFLPRIYKISNWIDYLKLSYWSSHVKIISNTFLSKTNKDGNVDAGTHLIIMDNLSCEETISKSNPVILNYYRQFLIKGFDWRYFEILNNLDTLPFTA